ncbi:MAG: DUF4936 domain-containing protein [Hydrogenophilales bacterium 17-61-9]|nr:MAG: DUF4936 domain-containing protein [Hydrogenophilales bacterium 17-61-9]
MRHAYVYYRIDPALASLAASRIDALLVTMASHCGQPPRRLNRCDDPIVWMETYEGIADFDGFVAALNAAVGALHCGDVIRGERHLECFSGPGPVP